MAVAMIGKDNWLFLTCDSNQELAQHCGEFPAVQEKIISQSLKFTKVLNELESKAINYYFMVYPDKSSIYQQYLPDEYCDRCIHRPAMEILALTNRPEQLIDLRCAYDASLITFLKQDTHHNYNGSYLSYRHIIEELRKKHPSIKASLTLQEVAFSNYPVRGGDLINKLNGYETLVEELRSYQPIEPNQELYHHSNGNVLSPDVKVRVIINNPRASLTCLIFHDSFTTCNADLLASHFKTTWFRWSHGVVEFDLIEELKPDIVLHLIVERFVLLMPVI